MKWSRTVAVANCGLVVVPVLLAVGCGSTDFSSVDPPELAQVTDTVVRYGGRELWMVVEYQIATMQIGEEWLFLDVAASAANGRTARIDRQKVFARTPTGRRIPLASQREFSQAYAGLRARLRQADVVHNPVYGYFPRSRRGCRFSFFSVPGGGVTHDSVTVNDRLVCTERFVFAVPEGVGQGTWVLGVDLAESEVRIPFQL